MTIFPISYFGNLSYFRKLVHAKSPVIDLGEHFIKQTLRSRCDILGANGIQNLSVPVVKSKGSKTPVSEIEISDSENWRRIHWKAIESAYGSAPYFDYYGVEVKDLILNEEKNLSHFNLTILYRILTWLDLEVQFNVTNEYADPKNNLDLRKDSFLLDENELKRYTQVFAKQGDFYPDLSILDIIFCEGPMARNWVY